MRRRARRNGGGGGCFEGCWQHRLLSRCYIEWMDEYLRRSTSCGFFFNQANLLRSPSTSAPRSGFPLSPRRFPLARIMARSESSCLCGKRDPSSSSRAALRRRIFPRPFVTLRANRPKSPHGRALIPLPPPCNQIPPRGPPGSEELEEAAVYSGLASPPGFSLLLLPLFPSSFPRRSVSSRADLHVAHAAAIDRSLVPRPSAELVRG